MIIKDDIDVVLSQMSYSLAVMLELNGVLLNCALIYY